MKKCLAVVVMVLAAAPMARADDASKMAKVHELFLAMHMDKMMNDMTTQMTGYMKQQFQHQIDQNASGSAMTPEQKKLTDDFFDKLIRMAFDTMSWKAIEPEYAKIYADSYTEDEITAITVFYKSPAGQAMLEKTPAVTAASLKIAQSKMAGLQPKMKELSEEYEKQLKEYSTPK